MTRYWLIVGCLAAPAIAAAQDTAMVAPEEGSETGRRPFIVTPFIGRQNYDSHSALRSSMVASLDLNYRVSGLLALGVTASAARPKTDGEFFPLVRLQAADTSLYYRVSQRVMTYTIGAQALVSAPFGRFSPYGLVGIGRYLFEMDPQATGRTTRVNGPMFSLGGGVNINLRQQSGITLDVRDVVFSRFNRAILDGSDPLFRDDRFDPVPAGKPGPKSTIHNLRLSIGVSFVPDSKER